MKFFLTICFHLLFVSALLLAPRAGFAEETQNQRLYLKLCGVCHGNQGDGRGRAGASLTPAPTDFTNEATRARLTREQMIVAVRDGVKGTSMVGYGNRLSANELEELVDYVRVSFMASNPAAEKVVGDTEGRTIYIEHCSACHGDNGNTAVWAKNGLDPAPRNFTAPEALQELSRERMINSVTYGRPGTAMMSFSKRLNPHQIEQVVSYVRTEFMGVKASPGNDYPGNIRADMAQGASFYMNNCFTCHGEKGDGKGPRAHFNFPRPRDFTSPETAANFNRAALFNAIKKGKQGTVMPAWQAVLSDQQVANVAEFVFQSFVVPEKKSLP